MLLLVGYNEREKKNESQDGKQLHSDFKRNVIERTGLFASTKPSSLN